MPLSGSLLRRPPGWLKPFGVPVVDPADPINAKQTFLCLPGVTLRSLVGPFWVNSTSHGAPTLGTSLTGRQFNPGVNDNLDFGLARVIDGNTLAISISFWIMFTSSTAGRILGRWGATNADQQILVEMIAPVVIQVATQDDVGQYEIDNTNTTLALNTLYHIVILFNGTFPFQLYINAASVAVTRTTTLASGTLSSTSTSKLQIGYETNEAVNSSQGYIDNIRIWNGRVLTPAEISRLYVDPWSGLIFPRDRIASLLGGARNSVQRDMAVFGENTANIITGVGPRTIWWRPN